tara:strand:+ start:1250 stop:1411 length:162 start_codon:yes stop_codon:yes gene_type:complete
METKLFEQAKKELNKNCLTLKMLGIHLPFNDIERFFVMYQKQENKKQNENKII